MTRLGLHPLAHPSPYAPYQDGDRAVLRPSAVLFLDLLGTVLPRTPAEAAAHLARTQEALEHARDWGDSHPEDSTAVVRWFSDNLGMAYPVTHRRPEDQALGELITDAADHQLALIDHDFIARGGIALGLFYADDLLIYGPALDAAVAMEKNHAVTPRIVLDEAASHAARRHLIEIYGGGANAPHRDQLAVDQDGTTFVNYLASGLEFNVEEAPLSMRYLGKHRDFIVSRLAEHEHDAHIHHKYRWLAAYHDWFLTWFAGGPLERDAADLVIADPSPLAVGFERFGHDIPAPPEFD